VVPGDTLVEHALSQAARLAAKPRGALAASRALIRGETEPHRLVAVERLGEQHQLGRLRDPDPPRQQVGRGGWTGSRSGSARR
jgi:enoyl-CoA hydratase/carnithine racemase